MKSKKNKKILVVIAIALVAAIAAGALIFIYLAPQRTTMYVFKENYSAGTVIQSSMLAPVQADSQIVVAGGNAATSTYFVTQETFSTYVKSGDVLRTDVVKGSPLMTTTLTSSANNDVEVRMDAASVAVTIPVNNTTGVTADIKPESHVNVYATFSSGGTYLLLENVRVLSVISSEGSLSGITLELNNQDAVTVINAVNTGSVYCGLVNGDGYIYESEHQVADDDIQTDVNQ